MIEAIINNTLCWSTYWLWLFQLLKWREQLGLDHNLEDRAWSAHEHCKVLGVVLKRALRARSFHAFDARHEEVSLGGGSGQSQEHGSCHSAQGKTLSFGFIFSAGTFLQLHTSFSRMCKQRITPHLQKDKRHFITISIYQLDPVQ